MRFRSTRVLSAFLAGWLTLAVPVAWGQSASAPAPQKSTCCIAANPHNTSWLTTGDPKALIVCIHGLGLCSSGFADFGEYMARRGFHCVAIDIHGFGNENEQEKVDFDRTIAETRSLLARMRAHYPDKPIFIAGESLGGSIAMRLAALEDGHLGGIICSAPVWKIRKKKRTVMKAVVSWFQPGDDLPWIAETFMDAATHNEQLKEHWLQDPHHRMHLSPQEQLLLNKFVKHTPDFLPRIAHTPVLFVQGLSDRLVDPQAVAQMFAALPNPDKEFVLVNGAEHLILEEGQSDGVTLNEIGNWIEATGGNQHQVHAPAGVLLSSGEVSDAAVELFHRAGVNNPVVKSFSAVYSSTKPPAAQ